MKKLTVVIFTLILLLIPLSTAAYEADLNLESKFGELVVTNIPVNTNIEKSDLSLNTIMLKASFNQYIFKEWADYYSLTFGTNLLDTSTEDTEIITYNQNINNKINKLKGETNFNSLYFDLLLANYLLDYSTPNKSYLILIGYEYDNYSYDSKKGSYYVYDTENKTNLNNIATHNIQYHMPYFGFIFNKNFNEKIKNRFVFKFSPYTYASLSSNNFYKDYTNESTTTGNFFAIKNNVRYNINKDMYITGGVQFKTINNDGSGTRYYYSGINEGNSYNIDTDLQFEEYSLNIGIQYLF